MKITSYQPKTNLKHLSLYWKSALIHKNVHSFCAVFNHFGYKLRHLERPSFTQPHLVQAIFKYVYPYNKVTMNQRVPREVADKLLPKLKELHNYFEEHTFVTEDGQLKPIIYSEATTEPDYDEEVYICPHCDYTHTSDCCVSHARLHCDGCGKVSRANPTPIIELEEIPDIYYDIAAEDLRYLIDEFLRINQDFQALHIEGRNLNWRGSSGFATSTLSRKDLLSKIVIGNDYRLTIKHNQRDNTLEVICAHHDATSYMTVTPTYTYCISDDVIAPEDLQDAKDNAEIANILEEAEYYVHLHPLELEDIIYAHLEHPLADLASDLAKSKQLTVSRVKLLKEAQTN